MTTSPSLSPLPGDGIRKGVLALVAAFLCIMLTSAFFYRMEHPSLTKHVQSAVMPTGSSMQAQFPENMPPAMAEALKKRQADPAHEPEADAPALPADMMGGKTGEMPGSMPQGMPGAMPGGMPGGEKAPEIGGTAMPAMNEGQSRMFGQLMMRLKDNPNDPLVLSTLGQQFMAQQVWDKAAIFLTRAMVADPGNAETMYLLGVCRFQEGKYQDAAQQFETARSLDPGMNEATYNLGLIYLQHLDKADEGRELLRQVAASETAPEELVKLAKELAE